MDWESNILQKAKQPKEVTMKRYTSLIAVALVLILSAGLTAQVNEEWTLRRNYRYDDVPHAIAVNDSGNVYVTGSSKVSGGWYDIYTFKINASGSLRWTEDYDGPKGWDDEGYGVAVDDSGNVYVAGYAYNVHYNPDGVLIKYNAAGSRRWVKFLGGYSGKLYDVVVDDSNYIYVAGYSSTYVYYETRDIFVAKYNTHGTLQWKREYDGPANNRDEAYDLTLDDEGNIYVTGITYNDYATLKYSPDGTLQWASVCAPGYVSTEVAVDGGHNVYVTGITSGSYANYFTVKYDSVGTEQWTASYSGFGSNLDSATAIGVDQAGNVYVTGKSVGEGTNFDYATVKYNTEGEEQWVARYNGEGNAWDYAYDLAVDNSGRIYVTGYSYHSRDESYNYVTLKYNPSGSQLWSASYNGPTLYASDVARAIAVDDDKNVYVTGESHDDYLTIKYSQILTDVKIVSLDSPADTVLSARTYTPEVTITNLEGEPVDFPVICEFDSSGVLVYCDTVQVTGLGDGDTTQVTFADWTTGEADGITYTMTVTAIAEDEANPDNNVLSKEVYAAWAPPDVGPVSLDVPSDSAYVGTTYPPKATVANFNEYPALSFDVVCEFDSAGVVIYADTVEVSNLAGGGSRQVSFANWTAALSEGVSYTMLVLASTEGDMNPANNMLTKSVVTIPSVHDVAPLAILSPPDQILAGHTYFPTAEVKNLGTDPETFDVRCEFDSAGVVVYTDLVTVTNLGGGQSVEVSFAPWSAGATGEFSYTMTVATLLASDLNPANDLLSKEVHTAEALADLDIQDYAGNLSANTMELTGVPNSIVVGSYVLVNPDDWEKNVDLFDGPGNVDLDLFYSCTDLSTYGGGWTIGASNINPDLNEVSSLGLGSGAQNILQAYITNNAHFETYMGKVTAIGAAEDGSTDADEFTLKVNVVPPKGGGKPSSFGGEPLASGNHLYWPNFGFGEQGFNLYRAESEEFTKLNTDLMNFTEYTDYDVAAGADYQYKLGLAMADESEVLLGPLSLTSSEEVGLPVLEQNWPNPWADATEICYFLPKGVSSATLKVYDVSGKLVKTLASGPQDAGAHSVIWDGRDEQGQSVASGVYFYMLNTGDQKQTKKMLLLR
ncbi:MAG: T9SS type A sorting domain-containing protein [Candidatus Stahlbacteria bacterium]|nr:MAG: T9SS type A sorting domain-containing protein [Candidatus Stahlbacteria bacterium]